MTVTGIVTRDGRVPAGGRIDGRGAGGRRRSRGEVRYASEYDPVTWSERAAAALDAAGYPEEAEKVRAGLSRFWRED